MVNAMATMLINDFRMFYNKPFKNRRFLHARARMKRFDNGLERVNECDSK